MANNKEIVSGLTYSDAEKIADQIFNKNDANHPIIDNQGNGFISILENGEPNISASSIFIKKVSL